MSPELLAATQGAQNIQAPASSLGASQGPELAALYRSSFQLPQATGAANAAGNIAQDQVAAAKAAAAEAKQRAEDMSNASKYRKVAKDDGGYDFYDPDGKQVDIATLTSRTSTKAAYWIKDSENPIDVQYLQDYGNLQTFMNAVVSKDHDTIKKFTNDYDTNNPLTQYTKGKGGIHNLLQQFQKSYQRYYVPSAWGASPGGPVVSAPQSLTGANNAGL